MLPEPQAGRTSEPRSREANVSRISALERRRAARRNVHIQKKKAAIHLHKLQLKGFRSVEHKKRFDDRVARNPQIKAPYISWNECTSYDPNRTIHSAEQIHQEQTRNSEILELDYLHELNEVWLADQERAYVEKREDAVQVHQHKMALMKEDFRSRFWTLELECTSKQELRIEQKMLWERMDEDFEEAKSSHKDFLRDFDTDFEAELRRFTQVIRRRTEDWIAHCKLHKQYEQLCKENGVPFCRRYANELGHQNVSLRNYGLGAASTAVIAKTLANNLFIHTLDLSGNFIGDEGASAIAEAIRGGKGLGMLKKSSKEASESSGLSMLCSLRDLNVSKNNLSSAGARYLLEACCLGKDQPMSNGETVATAVNVVEMLNLSNNNILDNVSATLEAVISSHLCGLRKLDLSYNKLGLQSARALAVGLSVNRTLVQLSMRWNRLVEGADEIAAACLENDTIQTLDLGFVAAGDACAKNFAEAIEEINVGQITESREDEEGVSLPQESKKSSLQQLMLDHNRISAEGAKPLLSALAANSSLRILDISGNEGGIWNACQDEIMTLRYGQEVVENVLSDKVNPITGGGNASANPDDKGHDGGENEEVEEKKEEEKSTKQLNEKKFKVLEHCTIGIDAGQIVAGSGGTSTLVEMLNATDYTETRYALQIGGVHQDDLWHESHDTELTVSVDGAAMGQLRDAIARICQKDRRKQSREDRKYASLSDGKNGANGGAKSHPLAARVNHRVLETWLQLSEDVRSEIPHDAFPNNMKIPVLARFTHHVSQNAMLAAKIMGHKNPKNVVRMDWPISCLPVGILLQAYRDSKKAKTRLQRMLKIKRGRRLSMSMTRPAPPAQFHCHISRVSTNKGGGSRFCVTNSLKVPFVLPGVEENREVVSEHEEEEEQGYGATSSNSKEDEGSPKKKRTNWAEKMALEKMEREEELELEKKRMLAIERRAQGDYSGSDMDADEELEGGSLATDSEEEEDRSGSDNGKEKQKNVVKDSALYDRSEELPSVLLTWEPASRNTGGRKLVQFVVPMFLLAGLDLDLGATIMMKEQIKKA